MGLRSFFNKVNASSLHTNDIAKAQSGAKFGAVSTESFTKRQEIAKNRQNISAYKDAQVVGGYRKEVFENKASTQAPVSDTPFDDGRPHPRRAAERSSRIDIVRPTRQGYNARPGTVAAPVRPAPGTSMRFQEPPSRGHNPYS